MLKLLAKKEGYSLVELMVALTLIVLISIAGLSVVYTSALSTTKYTTYGEAQNFCDNAWECIKASNDAHQFAQNVAFSNGVNLSVTEETADYTCFIYDNGKYIVNIKVAFDTVSNINVNATDNNGKEIISFSFAKGGA